MALTSTDIFIVERGGVQYQMTADQIADFVGAVRDYTVADITARNALTGVNVGDRVFVTDASSEADVDSGWAVYRVQSDAPTTFAKIQEQEGLDVISAGSTDLGYTSSPTQGTITSSTGNDAVLPVVTGTNAGLATPQMLTDSHVPATTSGTTATNPIAIAPATQVLSFSLGSLTALP
ncbi:MAG: hypothetical protein AAF943_15780 [Pseudomonadota bacterium]